MLMKGWDFLLVRSVSVVDLASRTIVGVVLLIRFMRKSSIEHGCI